MSDAGSIQFAGGLSGHTDAFAAAEQVCDQACEALGEGGTSLAMVFVTPHHVPVLGGIGRVIQRRLGPGCLMGVSGESVLGGATEIERSPGVSLLAGRLPGVELRPFVFDDLPVSDGTTESDAAIAEVIGVGAGAIGAGVGGAGVGGKGGGGAVVMLVDPFTVPLVNLLPAMSRACDGLPIVGGVASAGSSPGSNALLLGDRASRGGGIGVTISGNIRVDTVVSQGATPLGSNMVVTKARRNLILELGGRPAAQAVRDVVMTLGERTRALLSRGLLVGIVIDEYRDHHGRGDYLIRNVLGVDPNSGAIAVADMVRVGQTVRLHARDARTADEDLALLLDAQQLHERPAGALVFTCNGRGRRLFGEPSHDAKAVQRAFAVVPGGPSRAKIGREIPAVAEPLPLAGFFAGGEIGPVGTSSFLHGHSVSAALFRNV